ncbi:uracil-DNA glycosylase-like protein [Apodospora peruviana]|uniref:Uracil-DNA glycosylase-like protein n=1 Tax=Apodospora peruviana TaxID=516989 RepID=A0AAE0HTB1_9PEZI|nr:uracil-DNA glycosylase-like protein [Apodospora peruviana]
MKPSRQRSSSERPARTSTSSLRCRPACSPAGPTAAWEKFTQKVIGLVAAKRTRGVVFMAWGTPAAKRVLKVDAKRHLVLKSVHPSPLSASKGFFTCGHFKQANEWLANDPNDR